MVRATVAPDRLLALISLNYPLKFCAGTCQKGLRAMERFVHRKNVEHYRQLLKSGQLDDTQRQIILKLLAEEEAKRGPFEPDSRKVKAKKG
jgi:hypothetical protein